MIVQLIVFHVVLVELQNKLSLRTGLLHRMQDENCIQKGLKNLVIRDR